MIPQPYILLGMVSVQLWQNCDNFQVMLGFSHSQQALSVLCRSHMSDWESLGIWFLSPFPRFIVPLLCPLWFIWIRLVAWSVVSKDPMLVPMTELQWSCKDWASQIVVSCIGFTTSAQPCWLFVCFTVRIQCYVWLCITQFYING